MFINQIVELQTEIHFAGPKVSKHRHLKQAAVR